MTQFVQFSNADETEIVSVFCGPQDPDVHENLGEVEDDDPRYLDFKQRVQLL